MDEPHPAQRGAGSAEDFLTHLAPVVHRLGGTLIDPKTAGPADTPILWHGATVAFVRCSELQGALPRLVTLVEQECGCQLQSMDRPQKQAAVRRLDELGAFLLRGAVEDIAALMGVSRVTLYNYLNAIRPDDATSSHPS